METTKISDKDTIEITFKEDEISLSIKYNKRSTLETRYKILDKFKEIIRKMSTTT